MASEHGPRESGGSRVIVVAVRDRNQLEAAASWSLRLSTCSVSTEICSS